MRELSQGEIYKIEGIKSPVLIVSKDVFNKRRMIIGCPILFDYTCDALSILVNWKDNSGVVLCDQVKLIDMRNRGFSFVGKIELAQIMNISDAIQSIFDYV